jgi:arsenical pump membrane protein
MTTPTALTIVVSLVSVAGILIRPWRLPEAIWPGAGAILLVVTGLLPLAAAGQAIADGTNVYLFLGGMMLVSEMARREGVFDWIAAHAVGWAAGSRQRLFTLVYLIGIVVTALMSNDATAVVLTPAVFAVARQADADPLPALFACALVANAASFVLPISNPANLVLYGGAMPPLGRWLAAFALPSLLSIAATYLVLRRIMRARLVDGCRTRADGVPLETGGRIALAGIAAMTAVLLVTSALDRPLGPPTAIAGAVTATIVLARRPREAWQAIAGVSWSVLALVAGLFVLVVALERLGLIAAITGWVGPGAVHAGLFGTAVALVSNVINNLPAGLIAASALHQAHPGALVTDAALIGVDLGPNLSITGSLATILWLSAIRREGSDVSFWSFLKVGAVVMPPALILALGARLLLA